MKKLLYIIPMLMFACGNSQQKTTVSVVQKATTDTNMEVAEETITDSIKEYIELFDKPDGVLLHTSNVTMAESLMKTKASKTIFELKTGKKILYMPDEHAAYELVYFPNNGLIETIQECYDNHRPLVLTPDIMWLAICQGVSLHINNNFNALEDIIFTENKPNEIRIRNDSLEYDSKHWLSLINSFTTETKSYVNDDFYSFFVADFSTTNHIHKTAYQITMLEAYKKAFKYVGDSGCGIPYITITGSGHDWQSMIDKLPLLDKIGLNQWRKDMEPVLEQFVNVTKNEIDEPFWQNIYKNASEYAAFYISGWIIKFFPYVKETNLSEGVFIPERGEMRYEDNYIPNPFMKGDDYLLSTLSTDNFPSGMAEISIIWNNYFKETSKEMSVFAGFFAAKQYQDKSLEPFISWSICEKEPSGMTPSFENRSQDLEHSYDYWVPYVVEKLTDKAIYNLKKFKTHSQSIEHVTRVLIDSLQKNQNFNDVDYANKEVEFVVLTNGKLTNISITDMPKDSELTTYITNILHNLPYEWFPALAHPLDVLDADIPEEDVNKKIRVNSKITLNLQN